MTDPDFTAERQRIIRLLNTPHQAPCPHCQQLMIASTPAAPPEQAGPGAQIDGMRISANDPYVVFCGVCGERLENCKGH